MVVHVGTVAVRSEDILYIRTKDINERSNVERRFGLIIYPKNSERDIPLYFYSEEERDIAFETVKESMKKDAYGLTYSMHGLSLRE